MPFPWDAREKFAEADEVDGYSSAGNDKRYGGYNHQYSAQNAWSERLIEHCHADDDSRHGFQRPEYGSRCGADILNCACGAKK